MISKTTTTPSAHRLVEQGGHSEGGECEAEVRKWGGYTIHSFNNVFFLIIQNIKFDLFRIHILQIIYSKKKIGSGHLPLNIFLFYFQIPLSDLSIPPHPRF